MRVMKIGFVVATVLCSCICIPALHAAVIQTNGSQQNVQSAINGAGDGDMVVIPGGNFTWSLPITINRSVTLIGGGKYSVNASHDDTGNWPVTITFTSLPNARSGIEISGPQGGFVRVAGIHFAGDVPGGTSGHGTISINESNRAEWRVDNCKFTVVGNALTDRASGLGGLVDHVYCYSPGCDTSTAIVAMDKRNSYEGGWAISQPIAFGGAGFLFVEDSTLIRNCTSSSPATDVVDSQAGGKMVFRHNYVRNAMFGWHGAETGAPERSGYAFEIYENEFYWSMTGDKYHCAILHRGGTALIYDNTATNYQAFWKSWVYRSTSSFGVFGRADGTQPHDGNWGGAYPVGYPVLDQPGRGQAAGPTLATVQPQQEAKVFLWGNVLVNTNPVFHNNPTYVVEGRDYEISGDDSDRPSWYSPFPYPHPLQSGTSTLLDSPTKIRME